jgi:hypothetical protein
VWRLHTYAASNLTAQEAGVTLPLEAQFCAEFNRHVMDTYADWTIVSDYYHAAPRFPWEWNRSCA